MGNPKSAQTALQLIDEFGDMAGVRLNRNKTKAMWLGQITPTDIVFDIPWEDNFVKSLGIYFSKHNKTSNELNCFDERALKIKRKAGT